MHIKDDTHKLKLKQYLTEAYKATKRRDEEAQHLADILQTIKEEFDVPPKMSRKLIATQIKGNFPEVKEEYEELLNLNDVL